MIQSYQATIDYGDGSPVATAIITQPGGVGTSFLVNNNYLHTYANAGTYIYIITIKNLTTDYTIYAQVPYLCKTAGIIGPLNVSLKRLFLIKADQSKLQRLQM